MRSDIEMLPGEFGRCCTPKGQSMKTFKTLALAATFSFAITGVCLALASGHSRHPCGGVPGKQHIAYSSQGEIVCTKGPLKGKSAR
jgi:hypothetical protein